MESIGEWVRVEPKLQIIICDGSSFDFTPLVEKQFPNHTIECLNFENDQNKVKLYGRGYGEGEIIRYSLNHSRFIADSGCFAKCTAKLWVSNFNECTRHWNGVFTCKGVFLNVFSFIKKTQLDYVDTRFYITSLNFYRNNLINAHLKINKKNQLGLEECFLKIVIEKNIKKSFFNIYPLISGVGGGTGSEYKNSASRKIKEKIRLWLIRRKKIYSHLFFD